MSAVLILAAVFTHRCAPSRVDSWDRSLPGALAGFATAILCGFIAVETAYLYSTQRVDGPLWFEAVPQQR
jgi:hypothetical protein